jgi:drug/metabolite transporter (DMT)-like permease
MDRSAGGSASPPWARPEIAALVLAAGCWALGTIISKAALAEMPPFVLLPIQLAASLAVLLVLMRVTRTPLHGDAPRLLGRLGLLNPGIAYALSLLGLVTVTASVSVLVWAFEPLLILLLASWFLGERITPWVVGWSMVAILGLLLVVDDPAASGAPIGILLTVAGVGCCAIYTVVARRSLPEAQETSQVILAQQAYGLVVALGLLMAVVAAGAWDAPPRLTLGGAASAIASGALYYGGAYWLYLSALRRLPASIAASSFYLIPILGLVGAGALLGERLSAGQLAGALVVCGGVFMVLRQPPRNAGAGAIAMPRPTSGPPDDAVTARRDAPLPGA